MPRKSKKAAEQRPPRPYAFERPVALIGVLVPIAVAIITTRKK